MFNIKIRYKGQEHIYPQNTTLLEISKEFKDDYQFDILAALIDGKVFDLSKKIERDIDLDFVDLTHRLGNRVYERGLIFMAIKAVKDLYNLDLNIDHSVNREIYFRIIGKKADDKTAEEINKRMREIILEDIPFERMSVDRIEAIEYFTHIGRTDKAKSLKYVSNSFINLYKFDSMYDYFFGEMPPSSSCLKHFEINAEQEGGLVIRHPKIYSQNEIAKFVYKEGLFKQFKDFIAWKDNVNVHNVGDLNEVVINDQMSDLIYLGESNQNHRLWEIANQISSDRKIRLVLISGPSSSGKTTTSKKLGMYLRSLGLRPHAVSIDDYFVDKDKTPLKPNGEPDFESIKAIDLDRFNSDIKRLIKGEEVPMPIYDFLSGKSNKRGKVLKIEEDDILIVEGLHALSDELAVDACDSCKFKLYVSLLTSISIDNHNVISNTDLRLLRRMVRDHYHRGYNASETLARWQSVRMGEENYIFPYLEKADVVFNTSFICEIGLLKLYAEPLLFSVKEDDPYYAEALRLINILRNVLPLNYQNIPLDSILREFIGNSYFE